MDRFDIQAAGYSDVGLKRSQNQDSLLVQQELKLFIVTDGMGGHHGGQIASQLAKEVIESYFKNGQSHRGDPALKLQNAIKTANQAIQDKGRQTPDLAGMGTTATVFYFAEDRLFIGHVGDSRGYLIHPGCIWQLTRDHSLVQDKLAAGLITRSQLKTDRMKNIITRSIGFEVDLEPDIYEFELQVGDCFLICSDGVTNMLEDQQILNIFESTLLRGNPVERTARAIIDWSNKAGGDDNVTAIVIEVKKNHGIK